MIKSSPNKIIADGTNWHFFNELKREARLCQCAAGGPASEFHTRARLSNR